MKAPVVVCDWHHPVCSYHVSQVKLLTVVHGNRTRNVDRSSTATTSRLTET